MVRTNLKTTGMLGARLGAPTLLEMSVLAFECIGQYESSTAKLEKEGFSDDPEYVKRNE